ncbi:Translation elongation factor EFTs/EF1B [Theobroma cacao]|nr:Translation elongation factor EFTs/EF1B [Theobroma cacao]
MAYLRNAKRPLEILLHNTRLSSCGGHGFSTWATKGTSFAHSSDTKVSKTAYFCWVSRRLSSQASSSAEQISLIKQLRERTSAPIKDVKASLVDCNWDIEAAQKDLRKRGKVLAMKKSSRTASEGLLALAQNEGKAAIVELNCETDFVARNEIFEYLALALAKQALLVENSSQQVPGVFSFGPECLEDLKFNLEHPKISGETTVQNAVTEVAAMMGENVKLRRGFVMSSFPNGVAESTGKSQMAIEKMVEGRLRKYFEEVVLMEQKYFLNDSLSIKTILDNLSKEVGSTVKIGNFFRMEVGEGIQRLEASSTEEPVAQAV